MVLPLALLHALLVLAPYAFFRNRAGIILGGILGAVVAVCAGNPLYTSADLLVVALTVLLLWYVNSQLPPRPKKAPEAPAVQPAKPPARQSPQGTAAAWLVMPILVVLYFLFSSWHWREPAAQPPAPAPVASPYERALAAYRQRYPQIKPGAPQFDPALTERLGRRKDRYIKAGNSADKALDLAVADLLARQLPAADASLNARPVSAVQRPCEYKSVMSDEDNRACGIGAR